MARFWERNVPASRSSEEFTADEAPPVRRTWPALAVYFLAALIVALIVVFIARAIYHSAHDKKSNSSNSSNTAYPPQTTPTTPPGSPSQTPPSPSPGNLPNNGPGNVIALYIGTSLAAAGLHYIVTARRNS
jgi:hypothetical protein